MEESILKSTKEILGIDVGYTAFDLEILTAINSAFSILHQLGVGPDDGFVVEDSSTTWGEFLLLAGSEPSSKNLIKTYIQLKTRMLFDPPTTSFHVKAMEDQISQYEWRLNVAREYALDDQLVDEPVVQTSTPVSTNKVPLGRTI